MVDPDAPDATSPPPAAPGDDRLVALAAVADAIAATPGRLDKGALLATYLGGLADDALRLAARYVAGQGFAQWDKRTAQVGSASLIAALATCSGQPPEALRAALVEHGDMGDVAAAALPPQPPTLRLADVAAHLERLAGARAGAAKAAALAQALRPMAPLEARIFCKLLGGELRIGLREGAVEDALARMAGATVAQVQAANMRLGDLGELALLARHGRLHTATLRLFHPLKPMLATAAADAAEVGRQLTGPFAVEDKYDGIRCQAHVGPAATAPTVALGRPCGGRHVALFSRALGEVTGSFVDLLPALAALPADCIVDGELLPLVDGRIGPFSLLQRRLGRKAPSAALCAEIPVILMAFDLLYADGALTIELPYSERRARLQQLLAPAAAAAGPTAAVRLAPSTTVAHSDALEALFVAARAAQNEGLLVKRLEAPYRVGRRGRDWLKLKRTLPSLDVVVTAAEVGHGRRRKWLSDYTFAVRRSAEDATLLNVGKAYSGLTEAELDELTAVLDALTVARFAHGKVRSVRPEVVLEVAFEKVQASPRHKSGYALRFPRIVRWRRDKVAAEIDTLATVAALADPLAPQAD